MGEIPDIPSKMMVLTLLFLTFLSMAVGAPHVYDERRVANDDRDVIAAPVRSSPAEDATRPVSKSGSSPLIVRTAGPPPEDLLGYYIFTTYHLLLKEIRNEAGDTEIVALRNSDRKKELQEQRKEISEPTDDIYDFPAKKQASK